MNAVRFDVEDVKALARFLLELEREGAAYKVTKLLGGWSVRITGY